MYFLKWITMVLVLFQELRQHIVHYMKADITKPFGMILFDILPDIRQRYINQLGSECLTTT